LIKIDYAQYSAEELEDVWGQIDDRKYPERAIDIYLAMKNKGIARFDNQPVSSTFEDELVSFFLYSRNRLNNEEEYQYQQRELSEKEKRVMLLLRNNAK